MTLQELYEKHHGEIDFFWIYAQEARSSDTGLDASKDKSSLFAVKNHRTLAERQAAAQTCAKTIACEIPVLLDDLNNTVTIRYHAHPTRLFLVGNDGKLSFVGKPGPFGTDLDALAKALRALEEVQ